ncbi:MAG: TIGR04282 family arsenosugar biosynthesis glycosyltransferase [Pseudomonadota bacterium]
MVKEPRPGRVKTRLAADIGPIAAAHWFRREARALLRRLDDPRWSLTLAVSPDAEGCASRIWPAHLPRVPQGPGDLGQRMTRLLRSAPAGPVLIVGADIPALSPPHIARAFALLGRAPAILGPASDGGYWGIGLSRTSAPPSGLLQNVRWSTEHALADTQPTLPHPVALADTLDDIDTAADLHLLWAKNIPAGGMPNRSAK